MTERANSDISQLLKRFENIIAFSPVRIALLILLWCYMLYLISIDVWWGLGWGLLLFGALCSILGI